MKYKVLIVEDNELNMKLFKDLLTGKGYQVIVETEGAGTVNKVKLENPDLILMDIQLKDASGLDLIKTLKNTSYSKSIPIIAITAFAMPSDINTILESGCDLYLSKPVSISDFYDAVNKFLPLN